MSVKNLIAKFEAERGAIQEKIDTLKKRDHILELMLKELNADATSAAPKGEVKKAASKKPRKAGGQKKGALTVRDAILEAVHAAQEAIPANEIIAEAVRLSGGAIASIRTQINALTRGGELSQQPYEGRGFKYKSGDGKPVAKAKPKAKAKAKAKKGK